MKRGELEALREAVADLAHAVSELSVLVREVRFKGEARNRQLEDYEREQGYAGR